MPAPYFFHRLHDPAKTFSAMERLLLAVDPNTEMNTALQNVLGYAAIIMDGLTRVEQGTLSDVYSTQVLSYVSTELLERLADNPFGAAAEDLAELGVQLLHVTAALGLMEDSAPYAPDEITEIMNAGSGGFNEAILAHTVGYAIASGDTAYGPVLLKLLTMNKDEDLRTPYEWLDAFLLGLLIHAAWSYFPDATDRDREYIVQHYFYYAIVSGVAVRSWLSVAFAEHPELSHTTLMQKLSLSQEIIPEDITLNRGVEFANVVRQYVTVINQNTIPTLAAEKFLGKWYGTDAVSGIYRDWLRDALSAAYRLQTGNL